MTRWTPMALRGQGLQQKLQRDGCLDVNVLGDLEDQPDVVLDDVEHADPFLQCPASQLVADGEVSSSRAAR